VPEQVLSGGFFGDSNVPAAPPSADERVVHGGYFGGVPVGALALAIVGWPSDEVALYIDCLNEFGGPCEYQPREAGPFLLPHGAIFRRNHTEVDQSTGATVTSREPHAGVLETDLPSPWSDQDLAVLPDRHGVSRLYRVTDVQPDGEVGARVKLHEVPA